MLLQMVRDLIRNAALDNSVFSLPLPTALNIVLSRPTQMLILRIHQEKIFPHLTAVSNWIRNAQKSFPQLNDIMFPISGAKNFFRHILLACSHAASLRNPEDTGFAQLKRHLTNRRHFSKQIIRKQYLKSYI